MKLLYSIYHYCWSLFSAVLFNFPSRRLRVIGVTGTNGKSTTAEMIYHVLTSAGYKTALSSSVSFRYGSEESKNPSRMTMPGRWFLQLFLRRAVKKGCTHAVIEVTSEGILQHRHRFIDWNSAVFLNLSPEHIERHGGFENYKKAKGSLFKLCRETHIINADDTHASYFLSFPARRKIAFRPSHAEKTVNLPGDFNQANGWAAWQTCLVEDVPEKKIRKALSEFKGLPGRMEEVISDPFKVVVDYAFTPAALNKVYKSLQPTICVLGACGGGRDKWKRPVLGEIANEHCQHVIVTNEDPYNEPPLAIINEVVGETKATKIIDRREAIRQALSMAKPGDTVVITGKGCESSIIVGKKKIPWDDRRVVREEFLDISAKKS